MKDGQTGNQMYHGTGTLLTMDLTGILWVRTIMYEFHLSEIFMYTSYLTEICMCTCNPPPLPPPARVFPYNDMLVPKSLKKSSKEWW